MVNVGQIVEGDKVFIRVEDGLIMLLCFGLFGGFLTFVCVEDDKVGGIKRPLELDRTK